MKKLGTIIFVLTTLFSHAQKQWNVLDWKPEYTVNTYLLQQMHAQYDERDREFRKALSSATEMRSYIESARQRYLSLLDNTFTTRLINPQVTGTIQEQGYRIEKLVYESYQSHHVTANLYIPDGKGTFPAVLLFCGHEDISKATESYQQTAILFAKNGYVVLVIDPISQSERYQLTDSSGKPLTRGGTTEHTLLNAASNLLGLSTPLDELLDNKAGLDYLVTRPEVDTARIGCLGNSGGAMQTIYFAGFDPRIKVAAPCSYLATRRRTMELAGPADGCAQIPGEGKARLELADYLLVAAPKPVLILAGRYDFIDYKGTEDAYNELKNAYAVLGNAEKVSLFTYDDGHGISQPKREAAVRWFNRWLKNDNSPVHETGAAIKTPAQLFTTTTGQVNSSYKDEMTVVKRNLQRYEELNRRREPLMKKSNEVGGGIARIASVNTENRKVVIEDRGNISDKGITFSKKIIRKEGEPPLPVLIVYGQNADKIWIGCSEKGKAAFAASDSVRLLLSQGYAVVLCDLRGTGETEDKAEFNDPKYYNREYRNAMLALHIGKPLVSQRATDILSVIDMVRQDGQLRDKRIELKASGITVIPALFAAVIDNRIQKVYLSDGIRNYRAVFENPVKRDWYSYVVPGLVKWFDIPGIEALIGADKIQWLN